jgi:hypothetical protein
MQPDKKPTLKLQQMPKKERPTLQEGRNLARNPLDSRMTQSDNEETYHVLSTSEPAMPMHCYMVQSTNPHTCNKDVGNPLSKATMHKEYDTLLKKSDFASGSTSTRKEYFQVQMGPQDQEVQGYIGCQRTSSYP